MKKLTIGNGTWEKFNEQEKEDFKRVTKELGINVLRIVGATNSELVIIEL